MRDLPMPSDVQRDAKPSAHSTDPAAGHAAASRPAATDAGEIAAAEPLREPPSAKLIVQLFLVPLIIVALAVGIMFLIGRLAGGTPSFEDALARLRRPGGERTAEFLVGPGSKQ